MTQQDKIDLEVRKKVCWQEANLKSEEVARLKNELLSYQNSIKSKILELEKDINSLLDEQNYIAQKLDYHFLFSFA